jgi:hypothetical protein
MVMQPEKKYERRDHLTVFREFLEHLDKAARRTKARPKKRKNKARRSR